MRIRQVKPDFWADELVASWPAGQRLFYIGLWCLADDEGYFEERVGQVAADLYRYEPRGRREKQVQTYLDNLVECGRVVRLGDCHCARIPRMTDHQHLGGNRSFTVRDRHRLHMDGQVQTVPDSSDRVGKGREGIGEGGVGGDAVYKNGKTADDDVIARDRAILADPKATKATKVAARAHLQQLGVPA